MRLEARVARLEEAQYLQLDVNNRTLDALRSVREVLEVIATHVDRMDDRNRLHDVALADQIAAILEEVRR